MSIPIDERKDYRVRKPSLLDHYEKVKARSKSAEQEEIEAKERVLADKNPARIPVYNGFLKYNADDPYKYTKAEKLVLGMEFNPVYGTTTINIDAAQAFNDRRYLEGALYGTAGVLSLFGLGPAARGVAKGVSKVSRGIGDFFTGGDEKQIRLAYRKLGDPYTDVVDDLENRLDAERKKPIDERQYDMVDDLADAVETEVDAGRGKVQKTNEIVFNPMKDLLTNNPKLARTINRNIRNVKNNYSTLRPNERIDFLNQMVDILSDYPKDELDLSFVYKGGEANPYKRVIDPLKHPEATQQLPLPGSNYFDPTNPDDIANTKSTLDKLYINPMLTQLRKIYEEQAEGLSTAAETLKSDRIIPSFKTKDYVESLPKNRVQRPTFIKPNIDRDMFSTDMDEISKVLTEPRDFDLEVKSRADLPFIGTHAKYSSKGTQPIRGFGNPFYKEMDKMESRYPLKDAKRVVSSKEKPNESIIDEIRERKDAAYLEPDALNKKVVLEDASLNDFEAVRDMHGRITKERSFLDAGLENVLSDVRTRADIDFPNRPIPFRATAEDISTTRDTKKLLEEERTHTKAIDSNIKTMNALINRVITHPNITLEHLFNLLSNKKANAFPNSEFLLNSGNRYYGMKQIQNKLGLPERYEVGATKKNYGKGGRLSVEAGLGHSYPVYKVLDQLEFDMKEGYMLSLPTENLDMFRTTTPTQLYKDTMRDAFQHIPYNYLIRTLVDLNSSKFNFSDKKRGYVGIERKKEYEGYNIEDIDVPDEVDDNYIQATGTRTQHMNLPSKVNLEMYNSLNQAIQNLDSKTLKQAGIKIERQKDSNGNTRMFVAMDDIDKYIKKLTMTQKVGGKNVPAKVSKGLYNYMFDKLRGKYLVSVRNPYYSKREIDRMSDDDKEYLLNPKIDLEDLKSTTQELTNEIGQIRIKEDLQMGDQGRKLHSYKYGQNLNLFDPETDYHSITVNADRLHPQVLSTGQTHNFTAGSIAHARASERTPLVGKKEAEYLLSKEDLPASVQTATGEIVDPARTVDFESRFAHLPDEQAKEVKEFLQKTVDGTRIVNERYLIPNEYQSDVFNRMQPLPNFDELYPKKKNFYHYSRNMDNIIHAFFKNFRGENNFRNNGDAPVFAQAIEDYYTPIKEVIEDGDPDRLIGDNYTKLVDIAKKFNLSEHNVYDSANVSRESQINSIKNTTLNSSGLIGSKRRFDKHLGKLKSIENAEFSEPLSLEGEELARLRRDQIVQELAQDYVRRFDMHYTFGDSDFYFDSRIEPPTYEELNSHVGSARFNNDMANILIGDPETASPKSVHRNALKYELEIFGDIDKRKMAEEVHRIETNMGGKEDIFDAFQEIYFDDTVGNVPMRNEPIVNPAYSDKMTDDITKKAIEEKAFDDITKDVMAHVTSLAETQTEDYAKTIEKILQDTYTRQDIPIADNTEMVEALLKGYIDLANKRGINFIVLPNAPRVHAQRSGQIAEKKIRDIYGKAQEDFAKKITQISNIKTFREKFLHYNNTDQIDNEFYSFQRKQRDAEGNPLPSQKIDVELPPVEEHIVLDLREFNKVYDPEAGDVLRYNEGGYVGNVNTQMSELFN